MLRQRDVIPCTSESVSENGISGLKATKWPLESPRSAIHFNCSSWRCKKGSESQNMCSRSVGFRFKPSRKFSPRQTGRDGRNPVVDTVSEAHRIHDGDLRNNAERDIRNDVGF